MTPAMIGILIALGATLLVIAVAVGAARLAAVDGRIVEVLPFQSGLVPREHALSRFHSRWYPLALVFLAFDVEMLFMYPWATVAAQLGVPAIAEMFVFLGVLGVAVVWAWREGTMRWV